MTDDETLPTGEQQTEDAALRGIAQLAAEASAAYDEWDRSITACRRIGVPTDDIDTLWGVFHKAMRRLAYALGRLAYALERHTANHARVPHAGGGTEG